MSADDIEAGIDPAFKDFPARKSVAIDAALMEAITRKLGYIEWTPDDVKGRVEVTLDALGIKTYWLDKTAVLQLGPPQTTAMRTTRQYRYRV